MKKAELYGYTFFENGTIINKKGKELSFNKTINLVVQKESKSFSYARLVYYAFHRDFDFENHSLNIRHKDGNFKNNAISNLYVTNKKTHLRGENNSRAKLTDKQVEDIRKEYLLYEEMESKNESTNYPLKKVSYRKLADKYGVSHNLIKKIVKGECRNGK